MSTTGSRLKKIRKELGLSQADIANFLGTTVSYMSLVEKDKSKLSVENLVKLLLNYNINLNYLLAGVGEEIISPKFSNIHDDLLCDIDKVFAKYGIS